MKFSTILYKVGGNAEIFDDFCNRLRTMNMRRTEVVNQISKAIRKVDPTATAILYGSEARGDARSDSDIDVLILLDGDKMSLKREMEVTGPLNEIEWQTGGYIQETVFYWGLLGVENFSI